MYTPLFFGSLFWLHDRTFCTAAGRPAVAVIHICRQSRSRLIHRITVNIRFYFSYLTKMLEMVSCGSRTCITGNKHVVHCKSKFSCWNWKHYIVNVFFFHHFRCEAYYYTFYSLTRPTRKKSHRFRSGERGSRSPMLTNFTENTF